MSYERDALAAEGRLLREALDESLGWMEHATLFIATRQKMHKTGRDLFDGAMRAGFAALKASPLTTAEVERVRRLEAVLEAAKRVNAALSRRNGEEWREGLTLEELDALCDMDMALAELEAQE